MAPGHWEIRAEDGKPCASADTELQAWMEFFQTKGMIIDGWMLLQARDAMVQKGFTAVEVNNNC